MGKVRQLTLKEKLSRFFGLFLLIGAPAALVKGYVHRHENQISRTMGYRDTIDPFVDAAESVVTPEAERRRREDREDRRAEAEGAAGPPVATAPPEPPDTPPKEKT